MFFIYSQRKQNINSLRLHFVALVQSLKIYSTSFADPNILRSFSMLGMYNFELTREIIENLFQSHISSNAHKIIRQKITEK